MKAIDSRDLLGGKVRTALRPVGDGFLILLRGPGEVQRLRTCSGAENGIYLIDYILVNILGEAAFIGVISEGIVALSPVDDPVGGNTVLIPVTLTLQRCAGFYCVEQVCAVNRIRHAYILRILRHQRIIDGSAAARGIIQDLTVLKQINLRHFRPKGTVLRGQRDMLGGVPANSVYACRLVTFQHRVDHILHVDVLAVKIRHTDILMGDLKTIIIVRLRS